MNIAIIGCSGHYGYAFNAVEARPDDLRLVAIAPGSAGEDISSLKAACTSRGFTPNVYSDINRLFEQESVDLAVVNPWFCDAASVSIQCLSRGIHVFSEKPLATELSELEALRAAWEQSGAALAGMFELRYSPWFRAMEQAVENGEIGEIRMMNGRKSYKLGKRGLLYQRRSTYGGMLPWVAIHALDWVLRFGGAPLRGTALQDAGHNRDHGELEMTATAMLEMPGGVLATVTADYLRPSGASRHDDDRLMITGTRGTLEALNGQVFLENDAPRRELTLPPAVDPLLKLIDAIGTPEAARQAEDAFLASKVSLLLRQAGDEGRWIKM